MASAGRMEQVRKPRQFIQKEYAGNTPPLPGPRLREHSPVPRVSFESSLLAWRCTGWLGGSLHQLSGLGGRDQFSLLTGKGFSGRHSKGNHSY